MKVLSTHGYILIRKPNHPFANSRGYVYEHRLVMEIKLGRYLRNGETVHHVDRNKINNKVSNLLLFSSHAEHMSYHAKDRTVTTFPNNYSYRGQNGKLNKYCLGCKVRVLRLGTKRCQKCYVEQMKGKKKTKGWV